MMHKAWSNIEEVPFCFSRSSVKFQGRTRQKIADFDTNWACPDCNYNLNSPMALKWCTKLNIAWKKCPIGVQSHPSNFKVTQDKQLPIFTRIKCFRTVTPVWIHWWLWNDAQSFKQHRRGALLFLAATKQLFEWFSPSVCPSVCPSHLFDYVPIIVSSWNFQKLLPMTEVILMQKVTGHRSKVKVTGVITPLNRFRTVTPLWIHIWWLNDA